MAKNKGKGKGKGKNSVKKTQAPAPTGAPAVNPGTPPETPALAQDVAQAALSRQHAPAPQSPENGGAGKANLVYTPPASPDVKPVGAPMEGSRAVLVQPSGEPVIATAPVEGITAEEGSAGSVAKEVTPEPVAGDGVEQPLILGKFKTQEDLEKAYLESEQKISQVSDDMQTQTDLYTEMLKSNGEPTANATIDNQLNEKTSKEIGDVLFEDPVKAVDMMIDAAKAGVDTSLNARDQKQAKDAIKKEQGAVVKWLQDNHAPYLASTEGQALLDAYAKKSPAPTLMGKYEDAVANLGKYLKGMGIEAKAKAAEELKEASDMREGAHIETNASSVDVVEKQKLSASAIRKLMVEDPVEYKRQEPMIREAYREGRVVQGE